MSMQKKFFFFLMPAIIAALPSLAQADFASLNISSLNDRDKRFTENTGDYSYTLKPSTRQFNFSTTTLFTALAGRNTNITAVKNNSTVRIVKSSTPFTTNGNETRTNDIDISFRPTSFTYPGNSKKDIGVAEFPLSQLLLYAKALKQYAKKNGYDTSYAFLSNMGILCNKKRFFVVNLVTMEIEQSGLVSHGRGQGPSVYDKQYSNEAGSKSTSLGRYKILDKYKGEYGEAYRMAGLDSSNRNAQNRNIVLHSMVCIPEQDGAVPACVSDGCPAVSVNFLSSLRKIIDSRKKPVLLWIFDSNLEEAVERDILKDEMIHDDVLINGYHRCCLHDPAAPLVMELTGGND